MKLRLAMVAVFGVVVTVAGGITGVYYEYIIGGVAIGFAFGVWRALAMVERVGQQLQSGDRNGR